MKAKLGLVIMVAVIASAGMGISFALTDGESFGPLQEDPDVVFMEHIEFYDNEVEKDIGQIDAWVTGPMGGEYYQGIEVNITDAYPLYIAYVNFTVRNIGGEPINVRGISHWGYDHNAINITLGGEILNFIDEKLDVGQCVDGQAIIKILNGAIENSFYEFEIHLLFDNMPT